MNLLRFYFLFSLFSACAFSAVEGCQKIRPVASLADELKSRAKASEGRGIEFAYKVLKGEASEKEKKLKTVMNLKNLGMSGFSKYELVALASACLKIKNLKTVDVSYNGLNSLEHGSEAMDMLFF